MLTLSGGGLWRCLMPECEWPDSEEMRDAIYEDSKGE